MAQWECPTLTPANPPSLGVYQASYILVSRLIRGEAQGDDGRWLLVTIPSYFEMSSTASISSRPCHGNTGISPEPLPVGVQTTYPNSEQNLQPNHGVFGLVVSYGSRDVGH